MIIRSSRRNPIKKSQEQIVGCLILSNLEAAQKAIVKGTDLNTRDRNGRTALHDAAQYGHKEIIEMLIAKGEDVNAKEDRDGRTPLDLAIRKKQSETAALLRTHGAKTNEELEAEGK